MSKANHDKLQFSHKKKDEKHLFCFSSSCVLFLNYQNEYYAHFLHKIKSLQYPPMIMFYYSVHVQDLSVMH